MFQEQYIVDYSNEFPHAILAQGMGSDFMALFQLGESVRRKDGKQARYELVHRWLRKPCETDDDQSWGSVMGTQRTYLHQSEVEPLLTRMKREEVSIFDDFSMF
ncbi:hypothetical protein [Marinobacterium aestuariivivens]|uniref:Uncharacterized protein n=1 Tax=Marinobacterium aestuariivivens TaxID=1698799 RepID=A0ABW2A9X3_9GAMM